jgi:phage FluMu gp28-like protein
MAGTRSRHTVRRARAAPGAELLPYQQRWANDESRWKFGLMSRQVGKDFASGFEGIRDCVEAELTGRKVDWLIAAPSERQSFESLQKWKDWAEAFHLALDGEGLEREGSSEGLLKSATITFEHGSRVIAVPGKPDTVRGYSANVLLTEFAFFEQPDATWRAILPSITNSMRGGVKKVRLITTPNGIGNKAHDIWVKNYRAGKAEGGSDGGTPSDATGTVALPGPSGTVAVPGLVWTCHFVDIHMAAMEGLPVNVFSVLAMSFS